MAAERDFHVIEQAEVTHQGRPVAYHIHINDRTAVLRVGLAVATVFAAGVQTGLAMANDDAASRLPLVEVTDWPLDGDVR